MEINAVLAELPEYWNDVAPVVAAAQARFEAASAAGHGADNLTVVHRPDRGS